MAYIVPTANSAATQLLVANDTFYLAAGLRIANTLAGVQGSLATSDQISVIIDGAVSNATANVGAIDLNVTPTSFVNNRVQIGQTGSVTSTLGNGIEMGGGSNTVDNAGSISARQVGVRITGDNFDILNVGSIYGQSRAISVTGNGGAVTNAGSLRAASVAVAYTGVNASITNSGQINATSDGVTVVGDSGFVGNTGTIVTGVTGVSITGTSARISNMGQVHAQLTALDAVGNLAQIINDGTIFGRTVGAKINGNDSIIRNTGLVSGFDGLALLGDTGRVTNTGTVSATNVAIVTSGTDAIVQNTSTGHLTSDAVSDGVVSAGVSGNFTLQNAGSIEGNAAGVFVLDQGSPAPTLARITNTGSITGGTQALSIGVDTANILNRGTMTGGINSIANTQALSAMTIINEGTLRVDGFGASVAILGNTGVDTLRNLGSVLGNVVLGDGVDLVTNDGLIRGTVDLGAGTDAYTGLLGRVVGSVFGGAGNDSLTGGALADVLDGGTENDALTGNAGDDALFGRAGNDTLNGGLGNDRLTSGVGTDVLTGGAGADIFEFTSAATVGIGAARDQITDFVHGVDDLEMIFMAAFIGNAAFTAAGQVRYVQATGLLTGSTDADAAAEWALFLVNKPVIAAGDFVF